MPKMRKCPKCGNIENAYTYFCTQCGTKTVEYSEGMQNQPLQNQPNLNENKDDITIGDLSISPVESKISVSGENIVHDAVNVESQSNQEKDETSNINEIVEQDVTKKKFEWKPKYTYICVAVGACLILGVDLSQLFGGDKVTSLSEEFAQANNDTSSTYSDSEEVPVENDFDETTSYDDNTRDEQDIELTDENEQINENDQTKEHYYEFYIEDCTWEEAYQSCLDKGGYLVRFDSTEEYYSVISQIEQQGYQNKIFWLGGIQYDGKYWWIRHDSDTNSDWIGDICLNEEYPFSDLWLEGEPSYYDEQTDSYEDKMDMFYVSKLEKWVWNDVPNDILSVAAGYSGKIGYICEYEY